MSHIRKFICSALLMALVASCGGTTDLVVAPSSDSVSSSTLESSEAVATTPPPAVPTGDLPPPLAGYLDMSGCPTRAVLEVVRAAVGGCVAYVDWADLEPTRGDFDFSRIETQLDLVRGWNSNHPDAPIGLRVRVLTGSHSPLWAIDLGGPHVTISLCGPNATVPSCAAHREEAVPRFWTDAFGSAYTEFVSELSNRYSADTDLRDIAISRCTTIFDEPMVRTYGQAANAEALLGAGYTEAADLTCQHQSIDVMATLFPSTYVSQSFSTYEIPTYSNGRYETVSSDERAIELMDYMRASLGPRAVLGNNELGRGPGHNDAIYIHEKTLGEPLYYQLDSLDRLTNVLGHPVDKWLVYADASATAVDQGASTIEIRGRDYRLDATEFLAALGDFAPRLRANAPLSR